MKKADPETQINHLREKRHKILEEYKKIGDKNSEVAAAKRKEFFEVGETIDKIRDENSEFFSEQARQHRRKLLDANWELIKKKCTPEQIKGILHFIDTQQYGLAASYAKMPKRAFMDLLRELGVD
jgi:hypothetical protein